jgi:lysophospholipid acyltransferase (LPLAT)-like uncharacterized protein
MNLKKSWQNTLRFAGNYFLSHTVTGLCKSLNVRSSNKEQVDKLISENKNFVLAFWHGTMLLPWYLHGSKRFAALTSKSKDGDLLARILKHWNYNVVRGSSSLGGEVALEIILDYAKNNYSISITPDGPRGPKHKFKAGAVITAKKSGIPLVLAGVGFRRKKILSNWDKFEVPYFFSKVNIIYSDPIYLDEHLTYDETSTVIRKCEDELNNLQKEAQNFN